MGPVGAVASGGAPEALGRLLRLSRDGFSGLIGDLHRALGDAAGHVDELLQVVAHEVALGGRKVGQGATLRQPGHAFGVLLEPLLHEVEPLPRQLLEAARQNRSGLGDRLEVLRRLSRQILILAGEAEHAAKLVRDPPDAVRAGCLVGPLRGVVLVLSNLCHLMPPEK